MKCPKCGYVGYQDVARCRHCGYDFSLVEGATALALPLRGDDTPAPFADLSLTHAAATPGADTPPAARPRGAAPADESRAPGATRPAGAAPEGDEVPANPPPGEPLVWPPPPDAEAFDARVAIEPPAGPSEGEWLPLFGSADEPDDPPLVRGTLTPRPPLAVRRGTADLQRTRTRTTRTVRRSSERALLPVADEQRADVGPRTAPAAAEASAGEALAAGALARLSAALVDLVLVAAIDGAVLYFTLQIAGLGADQWRLIPKGPFLAFLLLLDGAYLVTFTVAGGQTLGKMLTGLRVVGVTGPVDLGRSLARAAGCLVSLATAGLGFLPALVSSDGRAIHDRLAGTRVVREP
jgi:uncharacterized RDD family membrane protein YckC